MDIPNLSNNTPTRQPLRLPSSPKWIYPVIVFAAILFGFGLSRIFPLQNQSDQVSQEDSLITNQAAQIVEGEAVEVGVLYGNTSKTFSDSAIGTVKEGGINGEGTHTLEREGGKTQNAALTSSVVDLELFVGKKVEVKGETNDSNKAGWLLDVGSIKILE